MHYHACHQAYFKRISTCCNRAGTDDKCRFQVKHAKSAQMSFRMLHNLWLLPWPASNLSNRFSVFAQWLSIEQVVPIKCAQLWARAVTPDSMQQGKQHHGLSIRNKGSRKLHSPSLPLAMTNACVAGNLAQLISRTRILVSKQRLHKINSYNSAELTNLPCHSACHISRSEHRQHVRGRIRTPGQVAAIRSSSKLDLTASGGVSRLTGLASGADPVKGRFTHQQAVNAELPRLY